MSQNSVQRHKEKYYGFSNNYEKTDLIMTAFIKVDLL